MRDTSLIVLLMVLVIAGIVLVPIANIWALNALFGLGIQYNLMNLAAMFWLSVFLGSTFSSRYIKS